MMLALGLPAGAQNFDAYRRSEQNRQTLEANTRVNIERIRSDTKAALSAQAAMRAGDDWRRRANGTGFSSYGNSSDDTYVPSSAAVRPMSRSAPPPAGVEWLARAAEAWRADRDADAAEYLRRASDAGSAMGTRLLGAVYAEGIGVPKDEVRALALHRQAATMGDTEALLHLGRAYALGLGTSVDFRESLDWFTKASRRSSTREQGERGAEAVRQLERLGVQLAALERCEKTGICEPPPSTAAAKP
jgi:TPR repeat protein